MREAPPHHLILDTILTLEFLLKDLDFFVPELFEVLEAQFFQLVAISGYLLQVAHLMHEVINEVLHDSILQKIKYHVLRLIEPTLTHLLFLQDFLLPDSSDDHWCHQRESVSFCVEELEEFTFHFKFSKSIGSFDLRFSELRGHDDAPINRAV